MTAYVRAYHFTYYSTPKVACTSLKNVIFEIENGFQFQPFLASGVRRHIHFLYPSRPFQEATAIDWPDNSRIALVRDPVERLLSAYKNRVLQHDELSETALLAKGEILKLVSRPTLGQFIERLEDYRYVSPSIAHHTNPQTYFIGKDMKFFDFLFDIASIQQVSDFLSERCGRKIIIPHHQRGGKSIARSELSNAQISRIKAFYEDDYKSFEAVGKFT